MEVNEIEALILVGLILIMLVITLGLNKLEKKYGVNRREAGEPLKKTERMAGWVSLGLLAVIVAAAINGSGINYMLIMLVAGMLALLQTLIEWKHVRNAQRSMVSFTLTAVLLLSLLGLMQIVEWTTAYL